MLRLECPFAVAEVEEGISVKRDDDFRPSNSCVSQRKVRIVLGTTFEFYKLPTCRTMCGMRRIGTSRANDISFKSAIYCVTSLRYDMRMFVSTSGGQPNLLSKTTMSRYSPITTMIRPLELPPSSTDSSQGTSVISESPS